ncbi:MAG: GNAT family N-acetyltransferase [Gammaproteobacteria bacterium]|nr:GNAT family N-acetyltransferase [Gammaproteobacteria bacterium]
MNIFVANSEMEIRHCFLVMAQLRNKLDENEFVGRVQVQQREGYQLACLEDRGEVRSLAGFRLMMRLSHGKMMYVDDLVTAEDHRSCGYGSQLFAWLVRYAAAQNCAELHLDSGVQRFAAHRFYCARNMHISAHHFCLSLDR